jgi:hypothetical protein
MGGLRMLSANSNPMVGFAEHGAPDAGSCTKFGARFAQLTSNKSVSLVKTFE